MKKIKFMLAILSTLILTTSNLQSKESEYKVLRIVDGDTFVISAPFLPKEIKQTMYLRLSNIDTPNVKRWANCDKEAELGEKAKLFVEQVIMNNKYTIKLVGVDKYNRLLGQIFINKKDLSDLLIKNNFARPYYGGKKQSWCH